jgi:putative acyl-CoA dehydrogenase
MEVLGGNGYTEELPLARIVREMPVNSIWEGSGNIMCLDVLRAFGRSNTTREAVLDELIIARGGHRFYDASLTRFTASIDAQDKDEAQARRFAQSLVTLMQAKLLIAGATDASSRAVAEAFCATRLAESGWGAVFGASEAQIDAEAILTRAWDQA